MGGIGGQGLLFLSSHINNDSATRTRTRTGPMIRLWRMAHLSASWQVARLMGAQC